MLILAKSLGLSPAQEDERVEILNSIMKNLGVSRHSIRYPPPSVHKMTARAPSDRVQGFACIVEGDTPRADKPLMTPMEVPLYIFLACLTMFVYSSVVL